MYKFQTEALIRPTRSTVKLDQCVPLYSEIVGKTGHCYMERVLTIL